MMDDGLYASLLEKGQESNGEDGGVVSKEGRNVVVVVSYHSHQSCRMAVASRTTRKRNGPDDPVKYTLVYYSFLDDVRRFSHLDALLTRLAPLTPSLSVVCAESLSIDKTNKVSPQVLRKQKQMSTLMSHLTEFLQSRSDLFVTDNTSTNHVDVVNMPKQSNASIDGLLTSLLGGDGTDRHVAYKGFWESLHEHQSIGLRAIGCLLHQLNVVKNGSSDDGNGYELQRGQLNSHLSMDRTAAECIHLLPTKGINAQVLVGGNDGNNSLYGLLNAPMKTKMGSRVLQLWVRQPLVDLMELNQRQCAVQTLVEQSLLRDTVRDEGLASNSGMDLDALATQLELHSHANNATKALQCLYKLHLFAIQGLPNVLQSLEDLPPNDNDDDSQPLLPQIKKGLMQVSQDLQRSVQLVEAVLDMEAAPREFLVKASYHEHLGDIRRELDQIQEELEEMHRDMNDTWSKLSGSTQEVRLESTESNNNDSSCWQFRIPDTNASKFLQKDARITVHRLLKNGVYFSTKELRQLGTKKQDLLAEYQSFQREIVHNAMAVSVTYIPVLERASGLVAQLDVLQSMAHVAAMHQYCKPNMTDSDQPGHGIHLVAARHPCVELQDNIDYIPNDVQLIFGESSFRLVTGPNMGGKSTYIRSVGAIVAMAQMGSYVPCQSATINIVHHILARVGAGDMQDKGISTFMAEMLEASSILKMATKRSLILMDELGRGTSTFDGYGLASAISQYMVQSIGCLTIFATHFHELTALEQSHKEIANCHVTAHASKQKLTFLYDVRHGPCLESFGIQVAEMANIPSTVIDDAKRKAKLLEQPPTKKPKYSADSTDPQISSAMNFLQQFQTLPLSSFSSNHEKKRAILNLLQ